MSNYTCLPDLLRDPNGSHDEQEMVYQVIKHAGP